MKKNNRAAGLDVKTENRTFNIEFKKSKTATGNLIIEGHAAIFDSPSDSGGLASFMEVIRAGAFTQAIKDDDVRALFNHNPDYVFGRNKAGTLELTEDATGLAVKIIAPDTTWARDLATSMERRDITGMSFSFIPRETVDTKGKKIRGDVWHFDTSPVLREIINARLFDVSIVTYPYYYDTDVSVSARAADLLKKAKERNAPEPGPAATTTTTPPIAPIPEPTPEIDIEVENLELNQRLKEKISKY